MNQPNPIQSIEERLRAFAQSRELSASLRDQAQRYLSRLVSPVRVTLFGRPSRGKEALLSAAIDAPLLPPLDHPPTLELRYGAEPSAQVTRADGSVTEPRVDSDPEAYRDAILAVIERPIPLLRRISFLDVQADEAPADQRAAIAWAAPRTDIALWCSGAFDEVDQALWDGVPDQVKDHAYLLLTDCDPDRAGRVKAAFRDEFHDVYHIDLDAPRELSGIEDLTDRLLEHARQGRQADADGALLFLRAQENALGGQAAERPVTRPVTRPLDAPAGADPRPAPRAADHVPRAAPAEPKPQPVTLRAAAGPSAGGSEGFEVFSAGLSFIRKRSGALLNSIRRRDELLDHVITAHCGETLVHLSDMLASRDDLGDPAIADLTDAVMEAESLVVLMENEKGEQPALDAVAILLQVRRDFEARLAA